MRVLVTGSGGMVGRAVARHCETLGDEVFAYDHARLDISDARAVRDVVYEKQPRAIINCAAWTDVDGCEADPERAFRANADGPENLAAACRLNSASLVTISTDYVFDGTKEGFYTQRDDPHPTSVYGRAKLEGERRSQTALARTMVVRTGWIFGPGGRNFLSTIIQRAARGERLSAIRDAYGTPTYAFDLAARLRDLVELDLPGVYHLVNAGSGASYEEFALEALAAAGCDSVVIESVSVESLKRPAPRPVNSRLRCLLSEAIGLAPLPPWQDSLRQFARMVSHSETPT